MENVLFLICVLLGLLCISSQAADPGDHHEAPTTTVTLASPAGKISPIIPISEKLIQRGYFTEKPSATDVVPSVTQSSAIEKPPPTLPNAENGAKFSKVRKKILASNFKNGNEKTILHNDRKSEAQFAGVDPTENHAKTTEKTSESVLVRNERTTELSRNRNSTIIKDNRYNLESRSPENEWPQQQQNASAAARKKMRISGGIIEISTPPFAGSQKLEPRESLARLTARLNRPSSTAALPGRKLIPVPSGAAATTPKSPFGFDSGGQTDWMPIIPADRMPMRGTSTLSHRLTELRPVMAADGANKTFEREAIVFPSDAGSRKGTSRMPVRTTGGMESGAESNTPANLIRKFTSFQDMSELPVRFTGPIKYKSVQRNETLPRENEEFNKEINYGKNYSGISDMDIPATGASWTLATLKGPNFAKTTEKVAETTEPFATSASNDTKLRRKSPNAFDNGLIFPPESIKMENVTKEAESRETTLKNPTSQMIFNTFRAQAALGDATWTPIMKVVTHGQQRTKETEAIITEPAATNRNNDSTPLSKIMKSSTPPVEATSIDVATEISVMTERPQFFKASSTEKSEFFSPIVEPVITEGNSEEFGQTSDDVSTDSSAATTAVFFTSDSVVSSSSPKTGATDEKEAEESETFTETEPKYFSNYEKKASEEATITANGDKRYPMNATTEKSTAKETKDLSQNEHVLHVLSKASSTERIRTTVSSPKLMTAAFDLSSTKSPAAGVHTRRTGEENVTRIVTRAPLPETRTENLALAFTQSSLMTSRKAWGAATTPSPSLTTYSAFFNANTSPTKLLITSEPAITTPTLSAAPPSTTASYKLVGKPETTEDGIYYKNYIPTTVNPRDEITEENVPAYLRLTVQTASWMELCSLREPLREAIIKMLGGQNVTADAVHFLNLNDRSCREKIEEAKGTKPNGTTMFLPVNMFLMNKNRDFDKNLSEAFLTIWGRQGLDFDLPIRKVDFVTPIVNLTELYEPPLGGSVVAAIVISCVAGICVILLGILFVIMKRRQKRFNYGQRCTPVSLDAYSLDSVSIYNSVRRKGIRASKRSYGNAAFDDPEIPSHPINFAGLANFSSGKEQLYEEFSIIPQVYPKVEELPEKAETKNRYANVIPLPETRVHLTIKDGDPLSDYINANYVRGNKGTEKLYIACQAPMESTIEDFWRMIWEQQCKVIMMLTDLQENGIEKCADYLPPNEVTDNLRLFGDYQVTLKKRDVKDKYIISNLTLKNMETNLWREVTHLWYLGWPDQGVPTEVNSLIAFLIEARSQMKTQNGATSSPPAVVHCSPGTGRTGTVIACDLCIREYEQNRMVDIPKCVFSLRRDRAGAVQTKDQYAFIYQVLNVYATKLSGGGIESI